MPLVKGEMIGIGIGIATDLAKEMEEMVSGTRADLVPAVKDVKMNPKNLDQMVEGKKCLRQVQVVSQDESAMKVHLEEAAAAAAG
jgi:hypothetical protein